MTLDGILSWWTIPKLRSLHHPVRFIASTMGWNHVSTVQAIRSPPTFSSLFRHYRQIVKELCKLEWGCYFYHVLLIQALSRVVLPGVHSGAPAADKRPPSWRTTQVCSNRPAPYHSKLAIPGNCLPTPRKLAKLYGDRQDLHLQRLYYI